MAVRIAHQQTFLKAKALIGQAYRSRRNETEVRNSQALLDDCSVGDGQRRLPMKQIIRARQPDKVVHLVGTGTQEARCRAHLREREDR